jgi:hypothetical protein
MRWPQAVIISVIATALVPGLAEARFGKGGSGGSSGGGRSSSSSSGTTHRSAPVDSRRASSPSSGGGSSSFSTGSSAFRYRAGYGYFSGAFVPMYGYGYRAPGSYPTTGVAAEPLEVDNEVGTTRATVNADFMYFVGNVQKGFTLGINGSFEGERWGFNASAQNISVKADDGSSDTDNLQQVNAHLTFAFLNGPYGRVRAELGADMIAAPSAIFLGPTLGFSGTLWIAGPLAFEASVYGSIYPFYQIDGRAGLVVGAGPIGFKLGWRTQLLDDRGAVDGVVHRDIYTGPYAGLGFAF